MRLSNNEMINEVKYIFYENFSKLRRSLQNLIKAIPRICVFLRFMTSNQEFFRNRYILGYVSNISFKKIINTMTLFKNLL